jgi:EAL domain-containing protein (putative c-di-GMP-specific phosphodiesterase class I)
LSRPNNNPTTGKHHAAPCNGDELQGYLFSRPVPEDEFVRWVRANAALAGD